MKKKPKQSKPEVASYAHKTDFTRKYEEVEYTHFKPLYRTIIKVNVVIAVVLLVSLTLSFYLSVSIRDTEVRGIDRLGRSYDLTLHPADESMK